MYQATIILEGGANRGIFTSGVLDYLMEKDIYFSDVIGVSMGSCNGIDYVSKQPKRTKDCIIHEEDKRANFNNPIRMIKNKSLMDMDLIFEEFPRKVYPFDFETFFKSDINCEIVTTNCSTGEAEYMTEQSDRDRLMTITRASCSMPLVSPMVDVDGTLYLDGGLADSIPIKRAVEIGNRKIVIVLTRNKGYRKKPIKKAIAGAYRKMYKDYPELLDTLLKRNLRYNQTINKIEELEEEGKIVVIRPEMKTISRLETKTEKLEEFYFHGYYKMEEELDKITGYLL